MPSLALSPPRLGSDRSSDCRTVVCRIFCGHLSHVDSPKYVRHACIKPGSVLRHASAMPLLWGVIVDETKTSL